MRTTTPSNRQHSSTQGLATKTRSRIIALLLVASSLACGTAKQVTRSSERHRLNRSPATRVDGYAITYDARGRGAYFRRDSKGVSKFCAEPPPDVAADLAAESSVDVSIDALLKFKAVEAALQGGGKGTSSATSSISDAATRTELVLVMRDALYRICELNANEVIDEKEATVQFRALIGLARNLGQRDNVGKLIDVVKVAFETELPTDPELAREHARALDRVLYTVTLLAAADQLGQAPGTTDSMAQAAIQKKLLESLVGAQEAQERILAELQRLEARLDEKRREIEAAAAEKKSKANKARIKDLEAEAARISTQIGELRTLMPR